MTNIATQSELTAFQVAHPHITRLDVIFPDLCGIYRGKRYAMEDAAKLFKSGLRLPQGVFAMSAVGANDDALGYGISDGDPDVPVALLAGTLVPAPWLGPDVAQVQCRHHDSTGTGWLAHDPRTVLDQAASWFSARGLTICAALELEFYLFERGDAGRPRPPAVLQGDWQDSSTQVYSLQRLQAFQPFFDDIEYACKAQNVPVGAISAEYSPGQYEINLKHVTDIALACDHASLLKRIIQGCAVKHGLAATFMAKPYPGGLTSAGPVIGEAGSGLHLHMSLLDEQDANLFLAQPELLKQAIGGLFETWAEAQLLYAPNINSYRRFEPESYAPMEKSWGREGRHYACRIPNDHPDATRLEWRIPGADANVYLAAATMLAGIAYGIDNACDPGPESPIKPAFEQDTSLPWTQRDAINSLTAATKLPAYLSADYLKLYAEIKRIERANFDSIVSRAEFDWYLLDHA